MKTPKYTVPYRGETTLSAEQIMDVATMLAGQYPELMTKLIEHIKAKKRVHCPYPFRCRHFPCEQLGCYADMMDGDGHTWRMS